MIAKFTFKISESLDHLSRAILLIIVALVVGNVILRSLGYPIHGAYELVGFLMASAIALALSYCAAQEGHVAVTLLVERLPNKYQAMLAVFVNTFILFFVIMIVRMLYLYGHRLFTGNYVSMTTKLPLFYFAYIVAFGFAGYGLVLIGTLFESIKKVRRI